MMLMAENTERDSGRELVMNCALKPRHNESVTWPFSEATCQIIGCVYFRRRSRRMWSDVWSLARPWRRFRRNWGLPGSYCMNGVGRGVAMAQPFAVTLTHGVLLLKHKEMTTVEYIGSDLSRSGFVRLSSILASVGPIPVGRSTWRERQ